MLTHRINIRLGHPRKRIIANQTILKRVSPEYLRKIAGQFLKLFQIVAAENDAGVEEGGVPRRPDFSAGFSDWGLAELVPPIAPEAFFAMSGD